MSDNSELANLRIPPNSIEAEQAVLGGLLIDGSAWEKIADLVSMSDFYRHEHRLIWQAIKKLVEVPHPIDVITVNEALETAQNDEAAGGLAYLTQLANHTPSSANIRRYAEIVRERSMLRQLIGIGSEIVEDAFQAGERDANQIMDSAQAKLFNISEQNERGRHGFIEITDVLRRVNDRIEALYARSNPDEITGIPTGFIDLDNLTSGLQNGDLIIVAGRPSMGKTAFSMNIAEHVAIHTGLPVAVFSMEMSAEQLATRMIGSIGKLNQQQLRIGKFEDEDWDRFSSALAKLSDTKIQIDETPGLSSTELRARARRLARQYGGKLGLIVIDYLQLMSGNSHGREQNRTAEISEISRALKSLARELNVPVIALSQLNRSVEQRPNKRPMMSDLRESGAIEQDADLIMFMYRDEYYDPNSSKKGTAEVIIGKHRNGPTGSIELTFLGHFSRFESHAHRPNF